MKEILIDIINIKSQPGFLVRVPMLTVDQAVSK